MLESSAGSSTDSTVMDNGFASPIVAAVAEPALPAALANRAGLLSARQQGRRQPDSLPS
ncbi:hypothetical protein MSPGM_02260 [Methylorubrum sp. GM97]|nr:hypothetical protein MSPGM_02260 [Methylorubrum sp. GM97]